MEQPGLEQLVQGKRSVVKEKQAVASSSHPLVTQTILNTMQAGGNAIDAAIAGSLLQAVVEPHMTNHAGTVNVLLWDHQSQRSYQLNSMGTLVPGLSPFQPLPRDIDTAFACIPGFMPGLRALYERFATMKWSVLCEPAIEAAREGYIMYPFQYSMLDSSWRSITYFPCSRKLFTPEGFLPRVGERFRNQDLAGTLEALAEEGPEYFTRGGWAKHFVKRANDMGWPIKLSDMEAIPPRWQEPLAYTHRGFEVVQSSPPEQAGVFSQYFLGVLEAMDVPGIGHYTESAESLYLVAHLLRWIGNELGLLQDPEIFGVPVDTWGSSAYHAAVAAIIKGSQPRIDLSEHVELTAGKPAIESLGLRPPSSGPMRTPSSCELSIVDRDGNWVQMLHTCQSGGIPGVVVDGVPMKGSIASAHLRDLRAGITGWSTGGGRIKSVAASTLLLKDGKPWLGMGSPGWCKLGIALMLHNILDFGMDPYKASLQPRMFPLDDDYTLEIENRLSDEVLIGMMQRGIRVKPLNKFNWGMGSFQISWLDLVDGRLNASADPRRIGSAGGID